MGCNRCAVIVSHRPTLHEAFGRKSCSGAPICVSYSRGALRIFTRDLSARRTFLLRNNRLAGELPDFWGAAGYWPALEALWLDGNAFDGAFPATWTAPTAFPAMRKQGTGM